MERLNDRGLSISVAAAMSLMICLASPLFTKLALHNLGNIALLRGDHRVAISRFHRALSQSGTQAGRSALSLAHAHYFCGEFGEVGKALSSVSLQLVTEEPWIQWLATTTEHNYSLALASAFQARAEYGRAVDEYQKALAQAPDAFDKDVYERFNGALAGLYGEEARRTPDWSLDYLEAKYLLRAGREQEGMTAMKRLATALGADRTQGLSKEQVGTALYHLGRSYEQFNKQREAIGAYSTALDHEPRIIDAYSRLASLYRLASEPSRAAEVETRGEALQPEYVVSQPVQDGWFLEGYDLDEQALEVGAEIPVSLYWKLESQRHADEVVKNPDVYQIGNRLIQVKSVTNLAPNGGFEWGRLSGDDCILGYRLLTSGHDGSMRQASCEGRTKLVTRFRGGTQSTVLELKQTDDNTALTGLHSDSITVDRDTPYLQTAWIRTEAGTGFLGCRYNEVHGRPYEWVMEANDTEWVHYSAVVSLEQSEGSCQLALLKRRSETVILIDNLLFFELTLPGD